jgi:hypothetical protein
LKSDQYYKTEILRSVKNRRKRAQKIKTKPSKDDVSFYENAEKGKLERSKNILNLLRRKVRF